MRIRTSFAAIMIAGAVCTAAFCAEEPTPAKTLQGSFIWSPSAPAGHQAYVVFRKTFRLEGATASAVVHLFADSRYCLWINGKYVERGPCRFDPISPDYDTLDVARFLQAGQNAVAVVVHHYHDGKPVENGDGFCGRIMRHVPGLTALLEITTSNGGKQSIRTDATWRAGTQNRFGPGAFTWTSIPDNVDARRDTGDWTAISFDDSAWEHAVPIDGKQWGPLFARRIALLRETEVKPLYLAERQSGTAAPEIHADKLELAKALPLELAAKSQVVIDADRFVQAYLELDMDAEAGSQLAFRYAQTFRASGHKPGGMQWTGVSRYTARQGRQTFMGGDTYGCKYVVIRCISGKVRLLGTRLINRLYPFDVAGKFACNDPLLNDIWQVGVRTILTCSEDAYVDCASRERVEWLGDAAMVSYPLSRLTMSGPGRDGRSYWSDPRLFGNILRHIGESVQPDGRVKAHHPSNRWDIHGYIEDYSCLWIQGLRTWHNHTNDLALVRETWPAVTAQLKWFLDRRTQRGLVKAREFTFFGNPLAYKVCEGATLNSFVVRSLADASELAALLADTAHQREYADASRVIREAINTHLWNEAAGTYDAGIQEGAKVPPTAHAAAIALYFDVVPPARRQRVETWLLTNMERGEFQPFQYAYCFEVLARMNSAAADRLALDVIRKRWAPMTTYEGRTAWEGFSPGEICHDMGSAPTIYLSRHVLGVDLDGPAVRHRLKIEPHLGDLKHAEGIVVTELGPVSVSWRRDDAGRLRFSVEIPAGASARLSLPQLPQGTELAVDGHAIHPAGERPERTMTIELGAGRHSGESVDSHLK